MLLVACDENDEIVASLPIRWTFKDVPTPSKGTKGVFRSASGKRFPSTPVKIKLMAFSPDAITADMMVSYLKTDKVPAAALVPVVSVDIPPSTKNGVTSRANDTANIHGFWAGVAEYEFVIDYYRDKKKDQTLKVIKIQGAFKFVDTDQDPVIIAEQRAVQPFLPLVAKYYKMVNAETAVQKNESELKNTKESLVSAEKRLAEAQRSVAETSNRIDELETALVDLKEEAADARKEFKRARRE